MKHALLAILGGIVGGIAVSALSINAARDGNGNYSLPAGNPVVSGTAISSTVHNNTMSDIASALTASLAKDGQTTPTANLPMGGFRHTGVANATARNNYATVDQIQDGEYTQVGSISGTNTVTGSLTPTLAAYVAGQVFAFTPANSNTGATTLNLNSLGALDVQKQNGDALVANDLLDGFPALVVLDEGADDFILINPQTLDTESGTFNVSMDLACTTSPTYAFDYQRIGNHVTLFLPSAPSSCTSDSTQFSTSATPVPTSIRPSSTVVSNVMWGATDNSVAASTCLQVDSSGGISFFMWTGSTCSATGWTAGNNKQGPNNGMTLSYMLGNP